MTTINQLSINQLFKIKGSNDIYKYHGKWLEECMPWQYQYQNVDTLKIYITTELIEVAPKPEETIESLKLEIKELKEKLSKAFLTNTVG